MKKIIATMVIVLALFTVAFCLDATDPNPPEGVAPIDYTVTSK